MKTNKLEKAKIGEQWKDPDGVVWQVSDVIDSCMPAVVVFCGQNISEAANQDKTAFDGESGWVRVVACEITVS